MAFLTLNTQTFRVLSNAASEKYNEHGIDRERMFDGTMRMIRRGQYRQWDLTSQLTESAANTLIALLKSTNLPLAMTGDLCGSACSVMPILVSNSPIQTADGFRRQVVFTLHETPAPVPPDTSARPWAFYRRGVSLFQDASKTVNASIGDQVKVWADALGNAGRDAVSDTITGYGTDAAKPVLETTGVHFGVGTNAGSVSGLTLPELSSFSSGEFWVGVRAANDPAPSSLTKQSWLFPSSISNYSCYPDENGHIIEGFGNGVGGTVDVGDVAGVNLTDFHVYRVSIDHVAATVTVYLDNVQVFTTGSATVLFGSNTPVVGSYNDDWNGWIRDMLLFDQVLNTTQAASWADYVAGRTDSPPIA